MELLLCVLFLRTSFLLPRIILCHILLLVLKLDRSIWSLLFVLASQVLRMAIMQSWTKYLMYLHLDVDVCFHIYHILLAFLFQPLFHHNHRSNMLVFYVPTIIVLIYTNLWCFLASWNMFFQIFLVWILFFLFLRLLLLVLQVVPFLQTIVLKSLVLLFDGIYSIFLHHVCSLLFLSKLQSLSIFLLYVFLLHICLILQIQELYHSLFHFHQILLSFLDYYLILLDNRLHHVQE